MKKRKVLRRLINSQGLSESVDYLALAFQVARQTQNCGGNLLQDGVDASWRVVGKLKCYGGRNSVSEGIQDW